MISIDLNISNKKNPIKGPFIDLMDLNGLININPLGRRKWERYIAGPVPIDLPNINISSSVKLKFSLIKS